MPPKFKRHDINDSLTLSGDEDERTELLRGQSDDEDFFLSGPPRTRGIRTDGKILETQAQIKEVEGVMKENITKIIDRGDKLDDLEDRSYILTTSANQFSSSSKRLRKALWWKDTKMKLILACVVVVILLLIFVPIIVKHKKT